jgi:hypothetical protein
VNKIDPTGESWVEWFLPCYKIYRKAKKVYACRDAASAEDCFEKIVYGDSPESVKNWIKSKAQGVKWEIENKMREIFPPPIVR